MILRRLKTTLILFSVLCYSQLSAQFVEERRIADGERSISDQVMNIEVINAGSGKPLEADVVVYGLNPRKPIVFEAIQDTSFEIKNYRLYTVSCVKEGFMYYAEKFWPDEKQVHSQIVDLKPLEVGLQTDLRNIVFLGDRTQIYHKSKPALAELIRFLELNPKVKLSIIGHVNGPDNARSKRFYRKASEGRAEAVKQYLVEHGIAAHRLEIRGAGNEEMIYPNPITDWQNEANRRVQIEVVGI